MAVERWTDTMLDELASSVSEMRESMGEMRESMGEMRESMGEMRESMGEMRESMGEMRESMGEMRESISEVRDSVDGLRITVQALLQVAAQHQQRMDMFEEELRLVKQRQAETDQRFNILLEEVRHLAINAMTVIS
jgi:uncharacterized coiled-coil DUF342 family protein